MVDHRMHFSETQYHRQCSKTPTVKEKKIISHFTIKLLNKFSAKNDCFEGHFREAIWPFLMIGQSFGVMPLSGVNSKSISKLRFEWKQILSLLSLFFAAVLTAYSLLLFWKTFTAQAGFSAFGLCFGKFQIIYSFTIFFQQLFSFTVQIHTFSSASWH